jgi:hypothetical protein
VRFEHELRFHRALIPRSLLVGESPFAVAFVMDSSESYDSDRSSRRRDQDKRRRVEAAVEGPIRRYGLSPKTGQVLSEGIYGLYRDLVAQKSIDNQEREFRKSRHPAERELAVRTAIQSGADTDVSPYVANAREFAAHMIR